MSELLPQAAGLYRIAGGPLVGLGDVDAEDRTTWAVFLTLLGASREDVARLFGVTDADARRMVAEGRRQERDAEGWL